MRSADRIEMTSMYIEVLVWAGLYSSYHYSVVHAIQTEWWSYPTSIQYDVLYRLNGGLTPPVFSMMCYTD